MLYFDMPSGGRHGWGVVGDNLANALARYRSVTRLGNEPLEEPPAEPGPLLQSTTRPHLRPRRSNVGYPRHVGYCVFEHDLEARRAAASVRGTYDVLVAASDWGEQTLREGGLTNVATIHHGIDHDRFHEGVAPDGRNDEEFVVFSGGKFELRKGQDIVVQAFRAFAARHADARLVAAWHNPWPHLTQSMAMSPYFPFVDWEHGTSNGALERWLVNAGLDLERVSIVPPLPNERLAGIYAASDVGLFPNRCEGSTNLVLMEYMACGRPAIATDFSGQRDVISSVNGWPLRDWRLLPVVRDGAPIACWCEPQIDEMVEALEAAYQDRDRRTALGRRAAADMRELTWDAAARQFLAHLEPESCRESPVQAVSSPPTAAATRGAR